jgi:hypothetical protein
MIRILLVAGLLATTQIAAAQDALRGKRIYLDAKSLLGTTVSCVDCHLGYPPGLFGIGRAANQPSIVEQAVNSIAAMTPLRGRMTSTDYADVAAYLGNANVPSPDLRVLTEGAAAVAGDASRLAFGALVIDNTSATSAMRLRNAGAVEMRITAAPRLAGDQPGQFSLVSTDCSTGLVLRTNESCVVQVQFRPSGAAGMRAAALQVGHDWVSGLAAVALLGTATEVTTPPPPPPAGGGGGGGTLPPWLLAGLGLLVLLRRPAARG